MNENKNVNDPARGMAKEISKRSLQTYPIPVTSTVLEPKEVTRPEPKSKPKEPEKSE